MADGCSCIVVNGDVVAQGSQFSLKDIEIVVAQVDLDAVCNILCVCVCTRSRVRAQAYQKALYDIHLIVWIGFTIVFATLKMNHLLMLFLNIQRHLCVASILLHFYIFLSPF